jgi:hypothetical protein
MRRDDALPRCGSAGLGEDDAGQEPLPSRVSASPVDGSAITAVLRELRWQSLLWTATAINRALVALEGDLRAIDGVGEGLAVR